MSELNGFDPLEAARFVIAVGAFRQLHGYGPTWRQARDAAAWPWRGMKDCQDRMFALKHAGLITFEPTPRSLDLTPAGRRWALSAIARRDG